MSENRSFDASALRAFVGSALRARGVSPAEADSEPTNRLKFGLSVQLLVYERSAGSQATLDPYNPGDGFDWGTLRHTGNLTEWVFPRGDNSLLLKDWMLALGYPNFRFCSLWDPDVSLSSEMPGSVNLADTDTWDTNDWRVKPTTWDEGSDPAPEAGVYSFNSWFREIGPSVPQTGPNDWATGPNATYDIAIADDGDGVKMTLDVFIGEIISNNDILLPPLGAALVWNQDPVDQDGPHFIFAEALFDEELPPISFYLGGATDRGYFGPGVQRIYYRAIIELTITPQAPN